MSEAEIIINNKKLSVGQAMTVNVALNSFLMSLQEPDSLGSDDHGVFMRRRYKERLSEIHDIIKGDE